MSMSWALQRSLGHHHHRRLMNARTEILAGLAITAHGAPLSSAYGEITDRRTTVQLSRIPPLLHKRVPRGAARFRRLFALSFGLLLSSILEWVGVGEGERAPACAQLSLRVLAPLPSRLLANRQTSQQAAPTRKRKSCAADYLLDHSGDDRPSSRREAEEDGPAEHFSTDAPPGRKGSCVGLIPGHQDGV